MSDAKSRATEESGSVPVPVTQVAGETSKETPRSFLQAARRNLTEEDFDTPAARRFLIAEIERLDVICADHSTISLRYHDQRVTIAELTKEARGLQKVDLLSFICLSIGSIGLGAAPGYFALTGGKAYGAILLSASVALITTGIVAKFRR